MNQKTPAVCYRIIEVIRKGKTVYAPGMIFITNGVTSKFDEVINTDIDKVEMTYDNGFTLLIKTIVSEDSSSQILATIYALLECNKPSFKAEEYVLSLFTGLVIGFGIVVATDTCPHVRQAIVIGGVMAGQIVYDRVSIWRCRKNRETSCLFNNWVAKAIFDNFCK